MANPAWFNEVEYLNSKLNQLTASGETSYLNINQVKTAIEANGYTTYEHFSAWSLIERTSPNGYFNTNEYLEAKAAQMGGGWTADMVAVAFQNAGYTNAYDHFVQWGWQEGVNPSNDFDISLYLDSKAAESGLSVAEVSAAFVAAGLDPISHYLLYGAGEGIAVTPVPVDEQVGEDAGQTYILTTTADVIVGTSGNDTINGNIIDTATDSTFQDIDTIDGGAGRDTLDLVVNTDVYTTPAMTNVETISVRVTGGTTASIDFSAISGVDTIEIKNSPNDYAGFYGYNVADEITTYKFTNVGNNNTTSSIDLEFLNTTFAGDADAVTVIVENAGDAANSSSADLYLENQDGDNVIEQYNVESIGTSNNNYLYLNDSEVTTTVTLTGSNDIKLYIDDADALADVDASAFTGNIIELDIADGEQQAITVQLGSGDDLANLSYDNDYTATGGAGDDRFVFSTEFNLDDSVDGGEGMDTLSVANSVVTYANSLTLDADIEAFSDSMVSIEVLAVSNTLTQDIDVSLFNGVQNVQLDGGSAFVTIDGGVESDFTLGLGANASVTVDMDDAATNNDDVLNVELNADGDTGFGIVEADDVETLNIAVTDVDGTSTTTDISFGALLNDVDTINVTGALDGVFTLTFDADVADTIDASGFDGDIVLNASANTDAITLIGGSGDDVLTGGTGRDTFTGGAGDDTFDVGTTVASGTAPDQITDFQADDTLILAGSLVFNTAAIELDNSIAVYQDYLDAGTDSAVGDVSWFQFGDNTYVVQDNDAALTFQNGLDYVVQLAGLVDLSEATFAPGSLVG